jgi:non-homologous end joining protein Ku
MGLPKIELTSTNPASRSFLKAYVGDAKFKVVSNSKSLLGVKNILGLKQVHAKDGGDIGHKTYCKACGKEAPDTELRDELGRTVERESGTTGQFIVIGRAPRHTVDYKNIQKSYFLDAVGNPAAKAMLTEGLRDTVLVGYLRLTANSDERPAAVTSPEPGVLVLHLLYYNQTELWASIPISSSIKLPAKFSAHLEKMPTKLPSQVIHRELNTMSEKLAKNKTSVKKKEVT